MIFSVRIPKTAFSKISNSEATKNYRIWNALHQDGLIDANGYLCSRMNFHSYESLEFLSPELQPYKTEIHAIIKQLFQSEMLKNQTALLNEIEELGPWFQGFVFDQIMNLSFEETMDRYVSFLQVQYALRAQGIAITDSRILDLGAAEGAWALHFLQAGAAHAELIECRAENCKKAKYVFGFNDLAEKVTIRECDVMDLSFRDSSSDICIYGGLMYHLTRSEQQVLMEALSGISPVIVLGTMVIMDTRFDPTQNPGEYRQFRHVIHCVQPDGVEMIDEPNDGIGAAITSKITFWPTEDYIETLANTYGYRVHKVEEWPCRLHLSPFARNARVKAGVRVGYHYYLLIKNQ